MCFICPRGDCGRRAGVCRATGALLGVPLHLRRMSRPAQSTARGARQPASGDLQAGAPPDRPTAPTGSLGSHDLSTTKASLNYEPRQGGSTERKPTHTLPSSVSECHAAEDSSFIHHVQQRQRQRVVSMSSGGQIISVVKKKKVKAGTCFL